MPKNNSTSTEPRAADIDRRLRAVFQRFEQYITTFKASGEDAPNRLIENVCARILNTIYSMNYQNANVFFGSNCPGFDLWDREANAVVQVTHQTGGKRSKINETISKVREYTDFSNAKIIILFCTTDKPKLDPQNDATVLTFASLLIEVTGTGKSLEEQDGILFKLESEYAACPSSYSNYWDCRDELLQKLCDLEPTHTQWMSAYSKSGIENRHTPAELNQAVSWILDEDATEATSILGKRALRFLVNLEGELSHSTPAKTPTITNIINLYAQGQKDVVSQLRKERSAFHDCYLVIDLAAPAVELYSPQLRPLQYFRGPSPRANENRLNGGLLPNVEPVFSDVVDFLSNDGWRVAEAHIYCTVESIAEPVESMIASPLNGSPVFLRLARQKLLKHHLPDEALSTALSRANAGKFERCDSKTTSDETVPIFSLANDPRFKGSHEQGQLLYNNLSNRIIALAIICRCHGSEASFLAAVNQVPTTADSLAHWEYLVRTLRLSGSSIGIYLEDHSRDFFKYFHSGVGAN
jgi:hypothetical protein